MYLAHLCFIQVSLTHRARTRQGISGKSGNLKIFFPEAKSQEKLGNPSISSGKSGKIIFSRYLLKWYLISLINKGKIVCQICGFSYYDRFRNKLHADIVSIASFMCMCTCTCVYGYPLVVV